MKAIIATLAITLSSLSFGQQGMLPVSCGTTEQYHKIQEESGEDISFVGMGKNNDDEKIFTMITSNKDFGTWTVVMIHPVKNIACVVGFGQKHSFEQ